MPAPKPKRVARTAPPQLSFPSRASFQAPAPRTPLRESVQADRPQLSLPRSRPVVPTVTALTTSRQKPQSASVTTGERAYPTPTPVPVVSARPANVPTPTPMPSRSRVPDSVRTSLPATDRRMPVRHTLTAAPRQAVFPSAVTGVGARTVRPFTQLAASGREKHIKRKAMRIQPLTVSEL